MGSRPPSGFLFEDVGSVLKGGATVHQRELSAKCSSPSLRGPLAIWGAQARHLFKSPSMLAFSAAPRPSNSSNIFAPTSQSSPSAHSSPVERTRFKARPYRAPPACLSLPTRGLKDSPALGSLPLAIAHEAIAF